jgi:hypothetical protein
MYLMARHAFHDLGYRHSVVLYARFGMALAAGEFRALAGGVELRRDGAAAAFALPPEWSVIFASEVLQPAGWRRRFPQRP